MSVFRDLARQMLLSNSFLEQMTDIFANEIEKQMRSTAGGDVIYVAKNSDTTERQERNRIICARFTGNNLTELAKEFHLTPRQVRRIVKRLNKPLKL
jgi:Mor family transcriptional regulator